MRISAHLLFLMLFTLFFETVKAQRTIEDSDPDYDKSYAMYTLMYGGFRQLGLGNYAHFSNFFSKHAKSNKVKEIRRRLFRKDSSSKTYKLESIQITKFKKGYLSEEFEIDYLKNRFTGKIISLPDTIKWIIYSRKGDEISVLEKENAYHTLIFSGQEQSINTYYFGKSKKLDSIITSSRDENLKQYYEYDSMDRLISGNQFIIEYSSVPAINRTDSASIDSLKSVPLFVFLKQDLATRPDSSFILIIKPKEQSFKKDPVYYKRIINLKGQYVYWQYHVYEPHRNYAFLKIYQFKSLSVKLNSSISLYHSEKNNESILQYSDYRQIGKKGIRTNYQTNYYLNTNRTEVQEVDVKTGNFETDTYKVVNEIIK